AENAERTARLLLAPGANEAPPPLALQEPWRPAFDEHFQEGITALQTRHDDAAVAAFERCLELRPRWPVTAYNLACAHAQGGDVDRALMWLTSAVQWGWGRVEDTLATMRSDPDLEPLRDDRRFRALIAELERE